MNYTENFNKLTKIINKHDPMGLIAMGAPKDEYNIEGQPILSRLRNNMKDEEITNLIKEVFLEKFSTKLNDEILQNITKDILKEKLV